MKTADHSAQWYERLRTLNDMPEVMEIYRMSDDLNYMLRVAVPEIQTYGDVYIELIASFALLKLSSS